MKTDLMMAVMMMVRLCLISKTHPQTHQNYLHSRSPLTQQLTFPTFTSTASARSGTNWPASGRPNTPVSALRSQPKLPQTAKSLKDSKSHKETTKLSVLLERILCKTLRTEDARVNAAKPVSTAFTISSTQASEYFCNREIPPQFLVTMKTKRISGARLYAVWQQCKVNFDDLKSFCISLGVSDTVEIFQIQGELDILFA
eukprot:g55589.t1